MKFRKKPVVIDAIQVKENCYDEMLKHFGEEPGTNYGYINGTIEPTGKYEKFYMANSKDGFEMWIKTLEGTMTADFKDWIIKGVNGEFYPIKPDILEKTYEKVED